MNIYIRMYDMIKKTKYKIFKIYFKYKNETNK